MGKHNTEHRKSLLQRVDHHEKLMALIADRLNHQVDPEFKMLAGAIQKNKEDIDILRTFITRSRWDKIKGVFK